MDGLGWMIILVLPLLWMGYGLALLIITACAFESKGIRRVLLWGAPQFIILCIATLLLYWINSRLVYVFVFFQPVLCITSAIFLSAGMSQIQFCSAVEQSLQAKTSVLPANRLRHLQSSRCAKP